MICSAVVGSPRAVYRSAMAARSSGSPAGVVAVSSAGSAGSSRERRRRRRPVIGGGQRRGAAAPGRSSPSSTGPGHPGCPDGPAAAWRSSCRRPGRAVARAVLAQPRVGGGHRGPADAQRDGQFPLGRQPCPQRHPAVRDQQPHPRRPGRRSRASSGAPSVAERAEQPRGPECRSSSPLPPIACGLLPGQLAIRVDACSSPHPPAAVTLGRLPRRLVQLYVGLALYGVRIALMVAGGLGLCPWDVLHQGVAGAPGCLRLGGRSSSALLVLLLWIPLRQRPGSARSPTSSSSGWPSTPTLAAAAAPRALAAAGRLLVGRRAAQRACHGLYIGARLGPGPRDGLMTGLVRRTGRLVRMVRTAIEVAVRRHRLAARRHARRSARSSTRWPSARWCSSCSPGSGWPTAAGGAPSDDCAGPRPPAGRQPGPA